MKWVAGATLFFCAAVAVADGPAPANAPRIRHITIRSRGLFNGDEAQGGFYRVANAVHSPTREALVRSFLLFREGDAWDPRKIAESEKNIRALDFIKSVEITAEPHDGFVDVSVVTEDEWTSDPNLDFGRSGGVGSWNLNFTQKDILGSGAEISVGDEKQAERSEKSLELIHPAFLHPYWNADLLLARRSDGAEVKIGLAQPFYSTSTPFSFDVSYDNDSRNERHYGGGTVLSVFHAHNREARAVFGLALPSSGNRVQHLFTGIDYQNIDFGRISGNVVPESRRYRWALFGYEFAAPTLTKLNYVDRDERYQDFDLGPRASVQVGLSPRAAGADRLAEEVAVQLSDGVRLGENALLIPEMSFSSRFGREAQNRIASTDVKFVWRSGSPLLQTLVSRIRIDDGRRLDRDVQFFADGLRGLRAYPAFAFEGDRSVVINVEDRFFLGRELLHLFAPGAAIFVDAGEAGASSGPFRFAGLKRDVGAGLRIAIPRTDSTMLRLDAAYALDPAPFTRRHLTFTFGTSQAF